MTAAPAEGFAGIEGLRERAMTPADAEVLAHLEAQVEETPWSAGNFLDSLKAEHLAMVVEDLSGGIAAWAVASFVLDEGELLIIGTAPAYQRRGIGRALLTALEAALRAKGVASLFLEVRAGNAPAIGLYEKQGFEVVGRRKGYYRHQNGREDAVLMRRGLNLAAGA